MVQFHVQSVSHFAKAATVSGVTSRIGQIEDDGYPACFEENDDEEGTTEAVQQRQRKERSFERIGKKNPQS